MTNLCHCTLLAHSLVLQKIENPMQHNLPPVTNTEVRLLTQTKPTGKKLMMAWSQSKKSWNMVASDDASKIVFRYHVHAV